MRDCITFYLKKLSIKNVVSIFSVYMACHGLSQSLGFIATENLLEAGGID